MGMTIDVQDPKAFAEWCNFIGAIPKAEYEARLKADMVAMLTDIQLELDEEIYDYKGADMDSEAYAVERCKDIIQQKINALKGEGE